jgi:hypothetical protein
MDANFRSNCYLFNPTMHAAQIIRPSGPFEIVEREIPNSSPVAGTRYDAFQMKALDSQRP